MSQNRGPRNVGQQSATGGGMSGQDTSGVNSQGFPGQTGGMSPFAQTRERQVEPLIGDRSPVPVPRTVPEAHRAIAAKVAGQPSLDNLMEGATEELAVIKGYGPRLVVLHDGVTGPASRENGGPFRRGRVVWASQLLGETIMGTQDQWQAATEGSEEGRKFVRMFQREMTRYMTLGALREAIGEEAHYDEVVFVEGEADLTTALVEAQKGQAATENDALRLRNVIQALGLNPDATPDEILEEARRLQLAPPQAPPPPSEEDEPPLERVTQPTSPPTAQTTPPSPPQTAAPPAPPRPDKMPPSGPSSGPSPATKPATPTSPPMPAPRPTTPASPESGAGVGDDAQL